ncbi:hypothetical protein IAQ61_006961 [Plenodomus lingam]|uniref:uncharacterized protein n=1 Tax=Leptosphaeria maculans TaxID=5022 RepID=UPI00331F7BF0|nr:hypothetical protein IAQ61_006961 [Plenodomus lingam]
MIGQVYKRLLPRVRAAWKKSKNESTSHVFCLRHLVSTKLVSTKPGVTGNQVWELICHKTPRDQSSLSLFNVAMFLILEMQIPCYML